MKRKISLSFLALAVLTLLTIPSMLDILRTIPYLFRGFSVKLLTNFALNALNTFAPLILVIILVLNTKRDMKTIAFIALIVLGCARLLPPLMQISSLPYLFSGGADVWLINLISYATNLIVGILYLMGAVCIHKKEKRKLMVVLTGLAIYGNIIPLVLSFLIPGMGISFWGSLMPFLLTIGVCLFPVTIFDYEHCKVFGGGAVKAVVAFVVVILIVAFASSIATRGGSSSGSSGGRNGFIGSDGEYHEFIPEFGDDVNNWMAENW